MLKLLETMTAVCVVFKCLPSGLNIILHIHQTEAHFWCDTTPRTAHFKRRSSCSQKFTAMRARSSRLQPFPSQVEAPRFEAKTSLKRDLQIRAEAHNVFCCSLAPNSSSRGTLNWPANDRQANHDYCVQHTCQYPCHLTGPWSQMMSYTNRWRLRLKLTRHGIQSQQADCKDCGSPHRCVTWVSKSSWEDLLLYSVTSSFKDLFILCNSMQMGVSCEAGHVCGRLTFWIRRFEVTCVTLNISVTYAFASLQLKSGMSWVQVWIRTILETAIRSSTHTFLLAQCAINHSFCVYSHAHNHLCFTWRE